MTKEGLSTRSISLELERSQICVSIKQTYLRKVTESVKTTHRFTPAEDAQLLALRADGAKWTEIHLQMPHRGVSALHSRHGRLTTGHPCGYKTDTRRLWTSREITTLHDMSAQDVPLRDIAARLNRTLSSVSNKIERLRGEPKRIVHWNRDQITQIVRMRNNDGLDFEEIAKHMECAVTSCKSAYYRYRATFAEDP